MATYSEITITFDKDFKEGDKLTLRTLYGKILKNYIFTWVTTRTATREVTIGTPTINEGETTAINFEAAFDLDYATGYVTTVQNTNEVLIQSETLEEDIIDVTFEVADIDDPVIVIDNYLEDANQHKTKFYISYCDDFGTNRNVFILKKGYTGGATELKADVNPISITYESSEDFKFSPIRPSQAEIFMIFGGADGVDFEEFWTADERMFKVEDVKDGTVEWSGYVSNSGFQYEFKGGLYYASITANDGLSTLENLAFVGDNQKPYGNPDQGLVYNNGFEFPFSLIITEILKKLELDLDLWSCIDSYETTMTKVGDVREADPLSASYVNVKTYIKLIEDKDTPYWFGSGEEWNCKEVLENILYIFGAKLYQEWGVWRVKSVNADIDFGSGDTQRYWRKYNTVGTYLGNYEVVNDEVNITCDTEDKLMIGNDHVMSMDEVYKAFRMNYEYTFLRDGDNPLELFSNSSFCDFDNNSVLAAPTGWERWRRENKNHVRIKDISIPFDDAGGNLCGIEFGSQKTGISTVGTDPKPAIWSSLKPSNYAYVDKGSNLTINIWNKYRFYVDGNFNIPVYFFPVYRLILYVSGSFYYLRNSIKDNVRSFSWEERNLETIDLPFGNDIVYIDEIFFHLDNRDAKNANSGNLGTYDWWEFNLELPPIPEQGYLEFNIHGLACDQGDNTSNYPGFQTYKNGTTKSTWLKVPRNGFVVDENDIPVFQVTGASIGLIPDESELPKQQDYVYNNDNQNYSLQVDPITIFNGDSQDGKHISNIIVPTNTGDSKNFWDDLSGSYGSSSLGLLTVREIMRQYAKPYRILEGTIKIQDARFGSVYTFDTIPNVRFTLQRGAFNKQKQYIEDATFVQLTSDVLPNGGTEGGNTLDAEWIPTGKSWCEVGEDALNTGYVVIEEEDTNPNSETYQETREQLSEATELTLCPLGQPRQYYYGSDDAILETADLSFAPITEVSDNEVQIDMDNDEGNYLYFVHLKSIGVVENVSTLTSPNNVLADWVYLADETIDGYIYRVLRTDYVMTEFTGFTHNFKFN